MNKNIFSFICIFTFFASCANANVLSTNLDSGFKILKKGHVSGAGTNVTADLNRDSDYDYWGGFCGKPKNYLCFPNPEFVFLSIPKEVSYITLRYTTDNGYGDDAAKVSSNGKIYSFNLHSFATYVNRPLRLQTYNELIMLSSNCVGTIPGKTLTPLSSEKAHGVYRVYDLVSEERQTTCEINIQKPSDNRDTKLSVSLGGMHFRYDNLIFEKIPSGKHQMDFQRSDSIKYVFYNKDNEEISSGTLFNSTRYVLNLNIEAYLDFDLLTPRTMKMFFQPQVPGRQFFHIKTLLKSNLPFINATIQCQYMENNKCAISDGVINLPLSMGVRSDHRTANNYSLEIKPKTPINLTSELGVTLYSLNKLTFMLGLDSEDVKKIPESFGKTYSGNITIIVEGGFD